MQGEVTSACNNIVTILMDGSPSFTPAQCTQLQTAFGKSATEAEAVLTGIKNAAGSMSSSDATTMDRVLKNQQPACDVSAHHFNLRLK